MAGRGEISALAPLRSSPAPRRAQPTRCGMQHRPLRASEASSVPRESDDRQGSALKMCGRRRSVDSGEMSTEQLYKRVARILEEARSQVARTVNTAMVHAYWHVGREIVEVEQAGKARAGYGDEVVEQLSARLAGGVRPRFQRPEPL